MIHLLFVINEPNVQIVLRFNILFTTGVKCAEKRYFMFAVERTTNIKDNPSQMNENT